MKIALLTQYYKPEMGAPQNRLFEMMSGLKQLGNDVCIVTGMPNYPTGKIFDAYKGKLTMQEYVDDILVKRYWLYASNARKTLPRIWNMISFSFMALFALGFLRKQKINYLIVESPPLTLPLVGYFLAKCTGAKLITNISDLWPLSAKELGAISGDGMVYKTLEKLEGFIYRKSHICMGQSVEIVEYISQHGGKNTYLFRNGVDPKRFAHIPLQPLHQDKPFMIVYAGLLGFAQGIYDICQNINFAALDVEFHIYGAGGEQALIEEYLAAHPNHGIVYHGKVSRDEIPAILMQADATLIPLVKNIFGAVPSKIYESMAAGVPIIFSGEGEGERIIREYNLGWVSAAKDYTGMIENIKTMRACPEEVVIKRKNCTDCAHNIFNRPKQIEALNQYLQTQL